MGILGQAVAHSDACSREQLLQMKQEQWASDQRKLKFWFWTLENKILQILENYSLALNLETLIVIVSKYEKEKMLISF